MKRTAPMLGQALLLHVFSLLHRHVAQDDIAQVLVAVENVNSYGLLLCLIPQRCPSIFTHPSADSYAYGHALAARSNIAHQLLGLPCRVACMYRSSVLCTTSCQTMEGASAGVSMGSGPVQATPGNISSCFFCHIRSKSRSLAKHFPSTSSTI